MNYSLRALVVDDEELIRELLVEALEPFSEVTEVCEACDGQEALEIFKEKPIDLVITDVRMPKVNGEDLVESLEEYCFKVPILVITGHGDKDMAIRLLRFGAYDFLEKPFESEALEVRLGRAIEMRKKILLELNRAEENLLDLGLIKSIDEYYQKDSRERLELLQKAEAR